MAEAPNPDELREELERIANDDALSLEQRRALAQEAAERYVVQALTGRNENDPAFSFVLKLFKRHAEQQKKEHTE